MRGFSFVPHRGLSRHRNHRGVRSIAQPSFETSRSPRATPAFAVIPGAEVQRVLRGAEREIVSLVEATYRLHSSGDSVNPPSYFLRFPDRPSDRIIALPASIGGGIQVDGVKWISSFPENVARGIPRASGVVILNDRDTGYPFACLEASVISATRTAAMATSAAAWLSRGRERPTRVGFIGAGLIARHIHASLAAAGWAFEEIGVHDLSPESVRWLLRLLGALRGDRPDLRARGRRAAHPLQRSDRVCHRRSRALHRRRLVVRALPAGAQRVAARPRALRGAGLGELRRRRRACLKANTSPHLTEQATGNRDFLDGTLHDVMAGRVPVPSDRPVVFFPFGLGVLDLAVAKHVYDRLDEEGDLESVDGFFGELSRHGVGG